MNPRVLHRRVAQMSFIDEFVDSTSKVLDKFVIGSMLDFKEQWRNSFTSDQSVEHNVELRKTNAALCAVSIVLQFESKMREWQMQGDFECLLNNDGFKHTDIQIQRRSERHERTPGFKDSNANNLVTSDQTNIRRKMEEGRRSWILNEIDATRREFVGPRQVGFC